jgi:hypothetical protein
VPPRCCFKRLNPQPVGRSEGSGCHELVVLGLQVTRLGESFHDFPKTLIRTIHEILTMPPFADGRFEQNVSVGIPQRRRVAREPEHGFAPALIRQHQDDRLGRCQLAMAELRAEIPSLVFRNSTSSSALTFAAADRVKW